MDIRIITIGAISCAIFAGGCNTACNVDPKGALDELMPVPVKVDAKDVHGRKLKLSEKVHMLQSKVRVLMLFIKPWTLFRK